METECLLNGFLNISPIVNNEYCWQFLFIYVTSLGHRLLTNISILYFLNKSVNRKVWSR